MTAPDDPRPRRARLPSIALPARDGGEPVPLRLHRHGTVLVLLGDAVREVDRAYVSALAAVAPALRDWDGRAVVIDAHDVTAHDELPFALPVLRDERDVVATAAGVIAPALLVVDQYGEVHHGESAEAGWLPVDEVVDWMRVLAVRCAG